MTQALQPTNPPEYSGDKPKSKLSHHDKLPQALNLPELEHRWVAWKFVTRDGRQTKVPVNPHTGGNAMANNSSTWGSYSSAIQRASKSNMPGVGLQVDDAGIIGVDFDFKAHDTIPDAVCDFLDTMPHTYIEWSPSGKGLRAFGWGKLPTDCRHKVVIADGVELEVYDSGRFLTVTGRSILGSPLADLTAFMANLDAIKPVPVTRLEPRAAQTVRLDDHDLITKAQNNPKFARLWHGDTSEYTNDHSRADLALCSMLCFWTGGDHNRIDTLFRSSALMRDKWDRAARKGETYGQGTIREALEAWNGEAYTPKRIGGHERIETWDAGWILERGFDIITQVCEHPAARGAYRDAWLYLNTRITAGHLKPSGNTITVELGGLREIADQLGGKPEAWAARFRQLQNIGLISNVTRATPHPRAPLVIILPLNPSTLPAFRSGATGALTGVSPARKNRASGDMNTTRAIQHVPRCPLRHARHTARALERAGQATIQQLEHLTGHVAQTIRGHLQALTEHGLIARAQNTFMALGGFEQAMHTERECETQARNRARNRWFLASMYHHRQARDRRDGGVKSTKARERAEFWTNRLDRLRAGEPMRVILGVA